MAEDKPQAAEKQVDEREKKNAVFSEDDSTQVAEGTPSPVRVPVNIPKIENPLAELGILDVVPYERVPLPSLGRVYPKDSPLSGKSTLFITPMTPTEEDILMSPALIKSGKVITKLIQSSLVDKSINVAAMLAGDRNAIMVAIRVTGYGSKYPVDVDCPSCGTTQEKVFDLAGLPIKTLGIRPVEQGANLFSVECPETKAQVHFRFLTGADEEEVAQADERRKKNKLPQGAMVTQRLHYAIKAVNGHTEARLINKFIRHMPAGDSLFLRNYMDKHQPGIEMSEDLHCTNEDCLAINNVSMPIGVSFFWPNALT